MEIQEARTLVKKTIFNLFGTVLAEHLWRTVPLSDLGIGQYEARLKLAKELELKVYDIAYTMTIEDVSAMVANSR